MAGLSPGRNDNLPSLAGAAPGVSGLAKRSLSLAGHRTSLALEPEFWRVLDALAAARRLSLAGLVAGIDAERGARPLASACRLAALAFAAQPGAVRSAD
jgi:predicted DNA-binding ribbon-helix-helix protein